MKSWYVMLMTKPPGRTIARVSHTYWKNMHRWYRIGRISEYRACRGLPEALVMALIYNHDWAAWIYRNGWWKGQ
ncbi:hypothetical protein LK537_25520 [Lachnoclostridium pacaense]|uniref:hypothetical protein n=1 Tax=Enterocloster hominis (ex Hitch et al. 2024) TaxID=1917870 RepID=UPI001D0F863E|nr:hypothetical protein [Lachnoclostridium pacaense]MCC2820672.1 hypothetical protein [Lachnoclostridium pacaense]